MRVAIRSISLRKASRRPRSRLSSALAWAGRITAGAGLTTDHIMDLITDLITCRHGISAGATTRGTAHTGTETTGSHGVRHILGTRAAAAILLFTRMFTTTHGTVRTQITTTCIITEASPAAEANTSAADCRWLTTPAPAGRREMQRKPT